MTSGIHPSSFRDPSGFVYSEHGRLYRQINAVYREHYELLMGSGLYGTLTGSGLLLTHQETNQPGLHPELAFRVIEPEPIPFISYPYEWCFGELKDAALLTLRIERTALDHGMTLKDASAYNVQFRSGKPVLIDTLSFERYQAGAPWIAYRQFCEHFLAPLALMSRCDVRLSQLLRIHLDGVPLDLASRLLPWPTRLDPHLAAHIHLHARSQRYFADRAPSSKKRGMSKNALIALVGTLESAVRKLTWEPKGTEWAEYYDHTNYQDGALEEKRRLVTEFLKEIQPKTVWDLGANTGMFSQCAVAAGAATIAFDIDPAAVERLYRDTVRRGEQRILPLVLDLTNPSPALGWENKERSSLLERAPADAVLALALVHHLAISNNTPLPNIAALFRRLGRGLIVEFVPKSDSQVKRLLATRKDVFPDYTEQGFEKAFGEYYIIDRKERVAGSERILYRMTRREQNT